MQHPSSHRTGERPANANVAALLGALGDRFGERTAFHDADVEWSYADLASAAAAVARRLERQAAPGERVALLATPGPAWVVHFFAILHAGAVAVLLDPELTDPELARLMAASRVRLLLAGPGQCGRARTLAAASRCPAWRGFVELDRERHLGDHPAPRERALDDEALIAFTAGTTGAPKGVCISHGNLLFQLEALPAVVPGPVERTLSLLPPHHLFGLTADLLGALVHGARIGFLRSLLPTEIARSMGAVRPTHMVVVPAFLEALRGGIVRGASARGPLARRLFALLLGVSWMLPLGWRRRIFPRVHRCLGGSLRWMICGAAPLAGETEVFFARLGIRVLVGYGLTETSPAVSVNTGRAHRRGSVGRPLPGVEVRIGAGGEIETRGPHVMLGYDGEPREPGTWLCTGDTGRIDAAGYLFVDGRASDLIVLGNGRKVHPDEVEPALFGSPLIAEGAVIGLPNGGPSQEVCAVVVPCPALRHRRSETLVVLMHRTVAHAARGVAPFKRPTRVVVSAEPLPRTSTRKVKRAQLRGALSDGGAPCPAH